MVSLVIQTKLDDLSAENRNRARMVADRLVEQMGMSEEAALERALFDLELEAAAPFRFRRAGLRWDE